MPDSTPTSKDDHLVLRYVRADDDRRLMVRGSVLFSLFLALATLDIVNILLHEPDDTGFAGYVAWGVFNLSIACFLGARVFKRWRRTRATPLVERDVGTSYVVRRGGPT
jgi:hypothetical protein